MTGRDDCPFCAIIYDGAPAARRRGWLDAIAITPLSPVVPGHVIVIPLKHVESAAASPETAAAAMLRAAQWAQDRGQDCNLITSVGPAATQSVRHLHIHVVPRTDGDGLLLPWSAQQEAGAR